MKSKGSTVVPRRRTFPLLLLLGIGLAGSAAAQTVVDRRVPASARGEVVIENLAGSVVVTGWDRAEVQVTGTLGRDVRELEVEHHGNRVEITVDLKGGRRGRHVAADLKVQVPRDSDLDIEVISAEVEVSGVAGEIQTEAVSGSFRLDGPARAIDVETVSGDVEIETDGAPVSVQTVSGRVGLAGIRRDLEVQSVSGRIEVKAEALEQAKVETVSGGVELSTSLARHAELTIECHSGEVELRLPSSTSARFEVQTYSGRIDNELGPPARRIGRHTPQQELDFTLGEGSGRVRIDSFSGTVALRKQ